jgi:hypothetical protein
MKRVFCGILASGLTISAMGCGGEHASTTTPPDTGEVAPEAPSMQGAENPPPPIGDPPP